MEALIWCRYVGPLLSRRARLGAPSGSIAASILLCLVGATAALAQTPTGTITGSVTGPGGAGLDAVEVVAVEESTGYRYPTLSSELGRYWIQGLLPGTYEITAGGLGYQAGRREGVTLTVGGTVTVDFTLRPGAEAIAGISVVVNQRPVETARSDVTYTITQRQIAQVPVESRRFMDLARLAPGTAQAPNTGLSVPSISVGALNAFNTGILVDGGGFTIANVNEQAGDVPLLAIREFEVLTSAYSAEYGQAASGIVNAVTRGGGNEPSVEGFATYRNQTLTAQGAFEAFKPDYGRVHFGGAVGLPIARDRTHAFVALERRSENRFITVETNGAFPQVEGTFEAPYRQTLLFARVDHRLSERDQLMLRYVGDLSDERSDFGSPVTCDLGTSAVGSQESGVDVKGAMHSVLGSYRRSMGSSALAETRLHVLRYAEDRERIGAGPAFLYPSVCLGGNIYAWNVHQQRLEAKQDFTFTLSGLGAHRIRVGGMASLVRDLSESHNFENGAFIFGGDTDALPSLYLDQPTDGEQTPSNWQFAGYVQDEWSPSRSLTVQLGLRYDFETDANNTGLISPLAGLSWVSATPRKADKNNFGPRVGVAWSPGADPNTVLRGGFGIFYNQFMLWMSGLETDGTDPLQRLAFGPVSTDTVPTTFDLEGPPFPTAMEEDVNAPQTRQFSLGFERALAGGLAIRLDGTFVQGKYQPIYRQLQTFDVDGNPVRYPDPEYAGGVWQLSNRGEAEAKVLTIGVRRASERWSIDAHYTLGDRKTTNESWLEDVPQTDPNSLDFSGEMGPAGWDERHRLVAAGDVALPWGFRAALVTVFASRRPFNALTGTDDNMDGDIFVLNDRPTGEGRNARRGPADYFTVDLGLRRLIGVGRSDLALVFNVYNLLNRTNYVGESVVGVLTSPNFGQALSAFPKRQAELGIQIVR